MPPLSIEDVLGRVKRPVRAVSVCLDGDLRAEHDKLTQELELVAGRSRGKMSDSDDAHDLAERVREVEAAMREASVEFTFRGLPKYEREAIVERYPGKEGRGWDPNLGAPALMAASSVEPKMTEEQARQLWRTLDEATADKLFGAAWAATAGSADIPFSERASGLTSGTA